jgi:hypothetical protein
LANSVAGVLVGLDLDRRPALVDVKGMLAASDDRADPDELQYGFLVIVSVDQDLAVVFCGSSAPDNPGCEATSFTLYVLDADVVYLRPGLFGDLRRALYGHRLALHAVREAILAPEHLADQMAPFGIHAEALPKNFEPDQYLALASECVGRGRVRFCSAVRAKMQTRPIAAALALRAGDEVETALRSALITAIWAKLGPAS